MSLNSVDTELAFTRAGALLGDAEFASMRPSPDEDRIDDLRWRVDAELKRMFAIYSLAGVSFDELARAGLSVLFVRAAQERIRALIGQYEHRI